MDKLERSVIELVSEVLKLGHQDRARLGDTAGNEHISAWMLEDKFGIEIPENQIIRLTNIQRIVEFLRPRIGAETSSA